MSRQYDETARLQNNFYRNMYHAILRWLFVEIAIMFLLIITIMYFIFSQHTPPYYATMLSGKIMPLTPGK